MALLTLDTDIIKQYGFPEAVVFHVVQSALVAGRGRDGWVKMTYGTIQNQCDDAIGFSTVRAAVQVLSRAGILIKGRPKDTGDHPMDRTLWYKLSGSYGKRTKSKKRG